jgi:hypothetical protein
MDRFDHTLARDRALARLERLLDDKGLRALLANAVNVREIPRAWNRIEIVKRADASKMFWRDESGLGMPESMVAEAASVCPEKLMLVAELGAWVDEGMPAAEAELILTAYFVSQAESLARAVIEKMKRDGVWAKATRP